jgi:type II secretory ATPase GspE/PulE/Tfp pilus assembly ATPase PilB-like protein
MTQDVVIELMDGRTESIILDEEFNPNNDELRFATKSTGMKRMFRLANLSSVMIGKKPAYLNIPKKSEWVEEVTTVTGKNYHVIPLEDPQFAKGFFAYSIEKKQKANKFIFFTKHGVKSRRQERPVESILLEQGLITTNNIGEAIKAQYDLQCKTIGGIISEQCKIPEEVIDQTIQTKSLQDGVSYKSRIGDILISTGLVTKEQVERAQLSQNLGKRKKTGELLIDLGLITEAQLLMALAQKFRREFVDLSKVTPDKKTLAAIPKDIAYQLKVFPVEDQGAQITVATSEPTDYTIEDTLRFYTSRKINLVIATSGQIAQALQTYYPPEEDDPIAGLIGQMSEDDVIHEEEILDAFSESDSQIISLVNKILEDAYGKRASDIHFEPGISRTPFEVRFRVDGICYLAYTIPEIYKRAILSRIKIMSNLDISEHRKPQSGKFMMRFHGEKVEFRVEITPTVDDNEDAVLRLLAQTKPLELEQLAFSPYNLNAFREMITRPQGIVLCVGPTGSGKTTTLHSALGYINKPGITIWTAENPVEIRQRGLRQVQVNTKIGYTFGEALRSFLRADPDVIMIGEMRDEETAKIGLEASLTGHLVFSTLHTNSAAETVVRLIEMGMPFYNCADALLGIVAQRLVRRLCEKCKKPYHPEREEYDELINYYDQKWAKEHKLVDFSQEITLWRRQGCSFCNESGYYDRIPIHEIIVATADIKTAIRHNTDADELKNVALREGMRTLRMDGVMKIMQGMTDFEQVKRVCL